MNNKTFNGVTIKTDDENVAAALYLAVSHYLAIKAKDKKIVGVPLADKMIEALEGVRNGFYKSGTMNQVRSFEINQDLLLEQQKGTFEKELEELDQILKPGGVM